MTQQLRPCKHCGETFKRAALFAFMADFGGARLSWNPSECPDGQKHDFVWMEDDAGHPEQCTEQEE